MEEDFVCLSESTHVINTTVFLQKISWTVESKATISLNYNRPLSYLSKLFLLGEIIPALPQTE